MKVFCSTYKRRDEGLLFSRNGEFCTVRCADFEHVGADAIRICVFVG